MFVDGCFCVFYDAERVLSAIAKFLVHLIGQGRSGVKGVEAETRVALQTTVFYDAERILSAIAKFLVHLIGQRRSGVKGVEAEMLSAFYLR